MLSLAQLGMWNSDITGNYSYIRYIRRGWIRYSDLFPRPIEEFWSWSFFWSFCNKRQPSAGQYNKRKLLPILMFSCREILNELAVVSSRFTFVRRTSQFRCHVFIHNPIYLADARTFFCCDNPVWLHHYHIPCLFSQRTMGPSHVSGTYHDIRRFHCSPSI